MSFAQTPLKLFRCPSDTTPELVPGNEDGARHFRGDNAPPDYEPPTFELHGFARAV